MYQNPILGGGDWQKVQTAVETSGYHHNVMGGFLEPACRACRIRYRKGCLQPFRIPRPPLEPLLLSAA